MNKSTSEAGPVEGAAAVEEVTGRFAIGTERRAATVVPATTPEAEEISLEGLDALIEAVPPPKKPVTVPPPLPPQARSHVSGLSPARSTPPRVVVAPAIEDAGAFDSLRPFYKELEGTPERAEVDIADLSLQADNPYLASSLVPPAQQPQTMGRVAVGVAAVVAVAAVGYLIFARTPEAQVSPAPVATAAQPASAPQPMPVAPQPELTAPAPAQIAPAPAAAPALAAQPAPTEPTAAVPVPASAEATPTPVEAPKPVAPNPAVATDEATTVAATSAPAAVDAVPVAVAPAAPSAPVASATPTTAGGAAAPADATSPTVAPELAPTAAPANLPEAPTREEVAAGFDALRPDLLTCAAGKAGVVTIDATLAGTGRVAYALIDGTAFKGTPEGSCMARTVRKARFPQFSQATLKVRYPVQL